MKSQNEILSYTNPSIISGGRVLIVDAQPLNLLVISRVLQDGGYFVDTAKTSDMALELFKTRRYDLMMLDAEMPKLNGFELAAIFRASPGAVSCPIIFMSVNCGDREHIKTGLELGAVDFVCQPIDFEILKLKVHNHIRNVRSYHALVNSQEQLKSCADRYKEKSKSLEASVNCAQRIQTVMLPDEKRLGSMNHDVFVVYNPKDIIGGDFYCVEKVNHRLIVACGDCTGHGVPGALLSMVGYNFLTQIIHEQRIFDPGEILTLLNRKLQNFFKGDASMQLNGMDLSLAVFQPHTGELEYASANHIMILQGEEGSVKLTGDKKAIGYGTDESYQFQTHRHKIDGARWLYQYTDGCTDQFGGPMNKKFGRERLENTVRSFSMHDAPEQQKESVEKALKDWKNQNTQTDDLTFIGARLEKCA
jgi:serine phosphatase RsbU (regulator of sigma subunit)